MRLRGFAKQHQESLLVTGVALFLALLAAYAVWGVAVLTSGFSRAITVKQGEESGTSFHIDAAKQLHLPGVE